MSTNAIDATASGSVTLRRSREGVFWVIIAQADGNDLAAMRAAVEVARTIDAELSELYPRRTRKPKSAVVHPPPSETARRSAPTA